MTVRSRRSRPAWSGSAISPTSPRRSWPTSPRSSESRSWSRAGGRGQDRAAKAISRATERGLIRLQCYEGLDEAKSLYEWNYRKQLLRIQASDHRRRGRGAEDAAGQVFEDIFARTSLTRPLLEAIASTEPVVLLIDEIDKTDQEFEAMLLEVLSDFQISIPELGVIEARTHRSSSDLEQLAGAHRGAQAPLPSLWLDYPAVEREMEIVRVTPRARRSPSGLVEVIHMVRQLDLKKSAVDRRVDRLGPGAAPARRRRRRRLGVRAHDEHHRQHRSDIDLVAERVGVKLAVARGLETEAAG